MILSNNGNTEKKVKKPYAIPGTPDCFNLCFLYFSLRPGILERKELYRFFRFNRLGNRSYHFTDVCPVFSIEYISNINNFTAIFLIAGAGTELRPGEWQLSR